MIHRLGDAYRSVVSSLTPVSTESKFVEEGKLTAEEFVRAGDQLVFKFPTWEWSSCEAARRASWLPEDKQYLITRNVPCKDRVRALDHVLDNNTSMVDGWMVFEGLEKPEAFDGGDIPDLDDLAGAGGAAGDAPALKVLEVDDDYLGGSADGALPDFSDLDVALAEADPASVAAAGGDNDGYVVAEAPDELLGTTRTYDLSITYDKYYQVPRMWLFGYDQYSKPLSHDEVFEDILAEYGGKTVTFDPHPHTGTQTVSIHPCKHAPVMKKVVTSWIEQGKTPVVEHAIFVLLKFISGIIPTINYDFTTDIEF